MKPDLAGFDITWAQMDILAVTGEGSSGTLYGPWVSLKYYGIPEPSSILCIATCISIALVARCVKRERS